MGNLDAHDFFKHIPLIKYCIEFILYCILSIYQSLITITMPILWRYLLFHFLRVFFLCVVSFIAILLTLRLGEIAYFATLGPSLISVVWFTIQQIPYVLPIAFPVSALISSALLVQSLSQSRELTAMRSCGFSLKVILSPVLVSALFLSAANFYVISELSTSSHYNAGQLKNKLRSVNPLLLLNNKLLMHMKGLYFDTLGDSQIGEYAEDIVFLAPTNHSSRLSLMVANRIDVSLESFSLSNMTLVTSHVANGDVNSKESLIIENMVSSTTAIDDFTQLLEKKMWNINNDHLQMPLLLVRQEEVYRALEKGLADGSPKEEIKMLRQNYYSTITEIIRRISVGLAVFSFTLLGLSFGVNISRNKSPRGILYIAIFASMYLVAFFIAKNFDQALILASTLYIAPHLVIWVACMLNLSRISRGIE